MKVRGREVDPERVESVIQEFIRKIRQWEDVPPDRIESAIREAESWWPSECRTCSHSQLPYRCGYGCEKWNDELGEGCYAGRAQIEKWHEEWLFQEITRLAEEAGLTLVPNAPESWTLRRIIR